MALGEHDFLQLNDLQREADFSRDHERIADAEDRRRGAWIERITRRLEISRLRRTRLDRLRRLNREIRMHLLMRVEQLDGRARTEPGAAFSSRSNSTALARSIGASSSPSSSIDAYTSAGGMCSTP